MLRRSARSARHTLLASTGTANRAGGSGPGLPLPPCQPGPTLRPCRIGVATIRCLKTSARVCAWRETDEADTDLEGPVKSPVARAIPVPMEREPGMLSVFREGA